MSLALLFSLLSPAHAAEGFWLIGDLDKAQEAEMVELGLELEPAELGIDAGQLGRAVVQVNGWCTGSFVSAEGLVLTNAHCLSDAAEETDVLEAGFWAKSRGEEKKLSGVTVSVLERVENVTERVVTMANAADEGDTEMVISTEMGEIEEEAGGEGLEVRVSKHFDGHLYVLNVLRVYTDVRLVGTMPEDAYRSTSPWENRADLGLLRVYVDDAPLKPDRFLEIAPKSASEGDFSMIYGFFGHSDRYHNAATLRAWQETIMPRQIELLGHNHDEYSSVGAYRRYLERQRALLADGALLARTTAAERALDAEVSGMLDQLETGFADVQTLSDVVNFTCFTAGSFVTHALSYLSLSRQMEQYPKDPDEWTGLTRVKESARDHFRDYDPEADRVALVHAIVSLVEKSPAKMQSSFFESKSWTSTSGSTRERAEQVAEEVMSESILTDKDRTWKFVDKPKSKVLEKDVGLLFAMSIVDLIRNHVSPGGREREEALANLRQVLMYKRFMAEPDRNFYPDADSTLRFSWGQVRGLPGEPANVPGSAYSGWPEEPSDLTSGLRSAWTDDTVVGLLTDNEVSGGGSGAPILDGKGRLIGVAYDGHPLSADSDLVYDAARDRVVAHDAAFFTMLVRAGASAVADELVIAE
jgi:V8-like Glu-specific endopeptidase